MAFDLATMDLTRSHERPLSPDKYITIVMFQSAEFRSLNFPLISHANTNAIRSLSTT
jgi:hypothetical protein